MKTYNIQIRQQDVDWSKTPHKELEFKTREQAVDFCFDLSFMVEREIRLSEGKIDASSGTYILSRRL